jgi:hypothetical protein
MAMGYPLHAHNDAIVFDPLRYLLWPVETTAARLSYRLLILTFVAGWSIYGFLRLHGARLTAAAIGASFYPILTLRTFPLLQPRTHYAVTAWTAIALFLLARALRNRRTDQAALAALAFGATCLAGHPQLAYAGLALAAAYTAAEAAAHRSPRVALLGAAAVLMGAAIAAIQLAPALELARAGTHLYAGPEALARAETAAEVARLFAGTVTPVGLVFILAGGLQARRTPLLFLTLLAAVLWLISGGWIYHLFRYTLPFFEHFKVGAKYFISPAPILASALAGFGVQRLLATKIPATLTIAAALGVLALLPYRELYALYAPPEEEANPPACVEALANAAKSGRIIRYRTRALPPNTGLIYGLSDVQVQTTQIDARYADFFFRLNPPARELATIDGDYLSLENGASLELPALDMIHATAILSGEPIQSPRWIPRASDPDGYCLAEKTGWWVYENANVLPRAYLIPGIRNAPSREASLDAVASHDFDPRGCAYVLGAPREGTCPAETGDLGTARITRDDAGEVHVAVDASRDAYLFLADRHAPGWEAEVDGRRAGVARANHMFRVVQVPKGQHEVRFIYRPGALRAGAAISLAALATCLAIALRSRPGGRSSPRSPTPPPPAGSPDRPSPARSAPGSSG